MTRADKKEIKNICNHIGLDYYETLDKIYEALNDEKNEFIDEEYIINSVIVDELEKEKNNKFKYAYSAKIFVESWKKAYTYEVEDGTKVKDTVYVVSSKGEIIEATVEEIFVDKGYPYQLKKVLQKEGKRK